MATDTMIPGPAISKTLRKGEASPTQAFTRTERFLGWFSIALGASEILAPAAIARITGARKHKTLVRSYGIREIAAGIGILSQRRRAKWLWGRVAGDVIDIASILRGSRKGRRVAAACSLAAVAGVTAADIICAQHSTRREKAYVERAESSILIGCTPEECYRFWHDVENFPRFLPEIHAVRSTGEGMRHWILRLPHSEEEVEWTAEVTEDIPNERISWRSARQGCAIGGSVEFERAPDNRGTFVRLQLEYGPVAQLLASPLSRFIGKHPDQLTHKALRRLKQLMEVGEILTTHGQPAGRRAGNTWLDGIAQ